MVLMNNDTKFAF